MKPWSYEPAADLNQTLRERLRNFPREPDLTVYGLRSAVALALRGWLSIYHRMKITGRENLPAAGSFILVANHSSHLDTPCLISALPLQKLHRVFPAAAKDYFFVTMPRLVVAAVVVNALPFGRQAEIRQSLELCRRLLENPGNILVIFPEGTRTTTGRVGTFRPGIGLLVAGTGIPVIPCHLDGAFAAYPKGGFFPRPQRIHLRIGRPQIFAEHPPGREAAERISEELQVAVEALAAG